MKDVTHLALARVGTKVFVNRKCLPIYRGEIIEVTPFKVKIKIVEADGSITFAFANNINGFIDTRALVYTEKAVTLKKYSACEVGSYCINVLDAQDLIIAIVYGETEEKAQERAKLIARLLTEHEETMGEANKSTEA